jgi:hypothetical protein
MGIISTQAIATLVLIIIPFSIALLLPFSSPYFQLRSPFGFDYPKAWEFKSITEYVYTYGRFWVALIPGLVITLYYNRRYILKQFLETEDETVVNEYQYITRILYTEIFLIITLTIFYYTIPISLKNIYLWPVLGNGFYFIHIH